MSIIFLELLAVLTPLRISVYTLAAWGMMVWAVPMLFESGATPASIIFTTAVLACVLGHLLTKRILRSPTLSPEIARNAAILHHLLFATIIAADRGLSGFLSGKYGDVPGQSIELYYAWNSSLYVAISAQVFAQRVNPLRLGIFAVALALLVIKGDRTIFAFAVIALVARLSFGTSPLAMLRRFRSLAIGVVMVGVLFVAKDFYGLYAEGRNWGEIVAAIDLEQSFSRLESWHNYTVLNDIVQTNLYYPFRDFIIEPLAAIPGSWLVDVDPHRFSQLIKEYFFSDWSDSAGVGASYFGQFYTVGGWIGVCTGILMLLLCLNRIQCGLSSRSHWFVFMSVAVLPVIVFYMHRNAVAQISSFLGRYVIIATAVYASTRVPIRIFRAHGASPRFHA